MCARASGYALEDAWHDYRLSAIMAMMNPVLYSYMYKTGGARGAALGRGHGHAPVQRPDRMRSRGGDPVMRPTDGS